MNATSKHRVEETIFLGRRLCFHVKTNMAQNNKKRLPEELKIDIILRKTNLLVKKF